MLKRWIIVIFASGALLIILVIAIAFVSAKRESAQAAKYLEIVKSLRLGTTYKSVADELYNAKINISTHGERQNECVTLFESSNKLLYRLHLASPVTFLGRLDFKNQQLAYKSTSMTGNVCCSATVEESSSTTSTGLRGSNSDSSGNLLRIFVEVSPTDLTVDREKAYAFNIDCISSVSACKVDEYLPTINDLKRLSSGFRPNCVPANDSMASAFAAFGEYDLRLVFRLAVLESPG